MAPNTTGTTVTTIIRQTMEGGGAGGDLSLAIFSLVLAKSAAFLALLAAAVCRAASSILAIRSVTCWKFIGHKIYLVEICMQNYMHTARWPPITIFNVHDTHH